MRRFADRVEAGRALAAALAGRDLPRPVVLALPRGGVPVAAEIAAALDAPLDLVLVRKIGVPDQPELALGAVIDGDEPEVVINDHVRAATAVGDPELAALQRRAFAELHDRRRRLLGDRPRAPLRGATAIVVDDGIATGATMRAALLAIRRARPARLVLAVPVAPADTVQTLRHEVDELVCLETPVPFLAIGECYRDFTQTTDREVLELLDAQPSLPDPGPGIDPGAGGGGRGPARAG